jgi:PmbA protein
VKIPRCEQLLEIAEEAVRQALRYGSDQADVFLSNEKEVHVLTRNRELEILKQAGSSALGLRVIVDHRSALVSTSDLSLPAVEQLAQQAIEVARQTSEDPHISLPEKDCYRDLPFVERWLDTEGLRINTERRVSMAREAEQAAFDFDPRIQISEAGTFSSSENIFCYANSHGYSGVFPFSQFSMSANPIAVEDGQMQRDFWYTAAPALSGLRSPAEVGTIAARRAVRRLGARKTATCEVPVVFDPYTAQSLVQEICNALNGAAIYRRASFLRDRLGEPVASREVTIIDDPTLPRGLGSRPFDGEGLLTSPLTLIREGRLTSFLLDSYSARKLGLPATACAVRSSASTPSPGPSNFYLKPGRLTPEDLVSGVQRGLYVTELIGFGVNLVNGDYSRGAVGLWIENGELTYPVHEVTIAGNLSTMLHHIEAVANDIEFLGPIASPSFKISTMTISGT